MRDMKNQKNGAGRSDGLLTYGHHGGADSLSHAGLCESGRLLRAAVRLDPGALVGRRCRRYRLHADGPAQRLCHYAPGTLVIKALDAIVAALIVSPGPQGPILLCGGRPGG